MISMNAKIPIHVKERAYIFPRAIIHKVHLSCWSRSKGCETFRTWAKDSATKQISKSVFLLPKSECIKFLEIIFVEYQKEIGHSQLE